VNPAYQCFHADYAARAQVDLRLIIERKFVPFEGASEATFQGQALLCLAFHVGKENLIGVFAIVLGVIHGGIGMLEEFVHVGGIIGAGADADAGADIEFVTIDQDRLGQAGDAFFRHHGRLADLFHIFQNDGKFISADP
jgi:hypothetical protein